MEISCGIIRRDLNDFFKRLAGFRDIPLQEIGIPEG